MEQPWRALYLLPFLLFLGLSLLTHRVLLLLHGVHQAHTHHHLQVAHGLVGTLGYLGLVILVKGRQVQDLSRPKDQTQWP